jgi:hypothetical protein
MNPNPPLSPSPQGVPGFGHHIHRDIASDQALEELRVRYARGELGRSDLLERSANLGRPPHPQTLPGQAPAPDKR